VRGGKKCFTPGTLRSRASFFERPLTRGDITMAHKKIERKKELDRRRKRRMERLKERVRQAKTVKKA